MIVYLPESQEPKDTLIRNSMQILTYETIDTRANLIPKRGGRY